MSSGGYNWKELVSSQARELILSGDKFEKQIKHEGNAGDEDKNDKLSLEETVWRLKSLNLLEISKTSLVTLDAGIGKLELLTSVILRGNKLQQLPSELGKCRRLKFIDVSLNALVQLPNDTLGKFPDLQLLNVEFNKLTQLPDDLSNCTNLLVVKFGNNEFVQFPPSLCCGEKLPHLSEIHARGNKITSIPKQVKSLTVLKVFDMSDNSLDAIPGELGDCSKLKDVNLKGNKVKDRRLMKLIDQCHVKQIMDYVRSHCPRNVSSSTKSSSADAVPDGDGESKDGNTGRPTSRDGSQDRKARVRDARRRRRSSSRSPSHGEEAVSQLFDTIKVLPVKDSKDKDADNVFKVIATPAILEMRKIVCCIVRNVDFKRENVMKRFISQQTVIHDGTLCGHRQHATIATHDLSKIEGQIMFDLRPPTKIKFTPLGRNKEMTAVELYKQLNDEAEALRKEKKRNSYSGIHKYLYLLKGKQRYPCLYDYKTVISFPPITNSENTKITEETKDLFLEVTGESVPVCKKVMDALLHSMVKLGVGREHVDPPGDPSQTGQPVQSGQPVQTGQPVTAETVVKPYLLEVEQVKVVDTTGKLYVVYPSRVDLVFDDVTVTREKE